MSVIKFEYMYWWWYIRRVWQEWKIVDNHFSAMHMSMGEQCGVHPREIDVSCPSFVQQKMNFLKICTSLDKLLFILSSHFTLPIVSRYLSNVYYTL